MVPLSWLLAKVLPGPGTGQGGEGQRAQQSDREKVLTGCDGLSHRKVKLSRLQMLLGMVPLS